MKERVAKLLPVITDGERLELTILNNGFVTATRENQTGGNQETLKRWRAVRKELNEYLEKLESQYFQDIGEEMPSNFKNKKEVFEYLEATGQWQISRSQFYAHAKQGLIRPDKGGLFQLKTVEKYAKMHLKAVATGQKVNEHLDKLQERRLEADTKAAELKEKREHWEFEKAQGKFIPRDQFEQAIVARAVAWMAHLNHTVQTDVGNWIEIVGGDQTRAPELVAAISRAIEQRMGDFAADAEIDVILEAN